MLSPNLAMWQLVTWAENAKKFELNLTGLRQAVFDIHIPILGTLIWTYPNLYLSKTETNIKHNFSFLIKSGT